jgi:hypothetical protein
MIAAGVKNTERSITHMDLIDEYDISVAMNCWGGSGNGVNRGMSYLPRHAVSIGCVGGD